jgi:hypothetical protein
MKNSIKYLKNCLEGRIKGVGNVSYTFEYEINRYNFLVLSFLVGNKIFGAVTNNYVVFVLHDV